jgi:isoquinoline 1-oxidoreductase beta subunit
VNRELALSRRGFIVATLAAGGSVLFYMRAGSAPSPPAILLNGWIRISPDGTVTVFSRATELGQGALTSLALIVAEELALDPVSVSVEMATVRVLLLRAAAQLWTVAESECSAENGLVHHTGGRTSSYAALAPAAARLPVPQDIKPVPRAGWRRLGRATPRIDIPAKTDGSAIYGVDVKRPGLLVATIAQCPMFGGKLESVDISAVEKMPGVKKVLALEDAVAVIATGYWPAKQALARLRPIWRAGDRKAADSGAQYASLRRAVQSPDHLFLPEGAQAAEVLAAHTAGMAAATAQLEALYEVPFLAHAPMEPMNATAHVTPRGAELWVPTQYQSMVREVVAELLGLPRARVTVHTTVVGGGFGRRTEIDYAIQAAKIAQHVEQPVKLIWSREEDTSRGYFRPMAVMQLTAGLDAQGQPTAFSFTAACPSIMDYSIERRNGAPQEEIEEAGLANARDLPYALPAQKIALASTDLGVPLTWMRSVGSQASVFGLECFLDEMAAAAKIDPVAYRRHLLRDRRASSLPAPDSARLRRGGCRMKKGRCYPALLAIGSPAMPAVPPVECLRRAGGPWPSGADVALRGPQARTPQRRWPVCSARRPGLPSVASVIDRGSGTGACGGCSWFSCFSRRAVSAGSCHSVRARRALPQWSNGLGSDRRFL